MVQFRSFTLVSTLSLLVFLVACGSEDSPMEPGGGGGGGGGGPSIVDDPSFSGVVMEVFDRKGCTAGNCHGSGSGGLTLTDAATSHANLVNVTSPTSGEIRVVPGDAASSYLITKLNPSPPFGAQMPLGGSPLDNVDLTNVTNWINQGAQNN